MSLPYRKSAGADRCRWPEPDDTGHCRFCGWALTPVRSYDAKAGFVIGHYRHRRPRISGGKGAQVSVPDPDEPEYPHEDGTSLALSEVVGENPTTNLGEATHKSYTRASTDLSTQVDDNRAFRQYTGAGDRLAVPTVQEWATWKARWA